MFRSLFYATFCVVFILLLAEQGFCRSAHSSPRLRHHRERFRQIRSLLRNLNRRQAEPDDSLATGSSSSGRTPTSKYSFPDKIRYASLSDPASKPTPTRLPKTTSSSRYRGRQGSYSGSSYRSGGNSYPQTYQSSSSGYMPSRTGSSYSSNYQYGRGGGYQSSPYGVYQQQAYGGGQSYGTGYSSQRQPPYYGGSYGNTRGGYYQSSQFPYAYGSSRDSNPYSQGSGYSSRNNGYVGGSTGTRSSAGNSAYPDSTNNRVAYSGTDVRVGSTSTRFDPSDSSSLRSSASSGQYGSQARSNSYPYLQRRQYSQFPYSSGSSNSYNSRGSNSFYASSFPSGSSYGSSAVGTSGGYQSPYGSSPYGSTERYQSSYFPSNSASYSGGSNNYRSGSMSSQSPYGGTSYGSQSGALRSMHGSSSMSSMYPYGNSNPYGASSYGSQTSGMPFGSQSMSSGSSYGTSGVASGSPYSYPSSSSRYPYGESNSQGSVRFGYGGSSSRSSYESSSVASGQSYGSSNNEIGSSSYRQSLGSPSTYGSSSSGYNNGNYGSQNRGMGSETSFGSLTGQYDSSKINPSYSGSSYGSSSSSGSQYGGSSQRISSLPSETGTGGSSSSYGSSNAAAGNPSSSRLQLGGSSQGISSVLSQAGTSGSSYRSNLNSGSSSSSFSGQQYGQSSQGMSNFPSDSSVGGSSSSYGSDTGVSSSSSGLQYGGSFQGSSSFPSGTGLGSGLSYSYSSNAGLGSSSNSRYGGSSQGSSSFLSGTGASSSSIATSFGGSRIGTGSTSNADNGRQLSSSSSYPQGSYHQIGSSYPYRSSSQTSYQDSNVMSGVPSSISVGTNADTVPSSGSLYAGTGSLGQRFGNSDALPKMQLHGESHSIVSSHSSFTGNEQAVGNRTTYLKVENTLGRNNNLQSDTSNLYGSNSNVQDSNYGSSRNLYGTGSNSYQSSNSYDYNPASLGSSSSQPNSYQSRNNQQNSQNVSRVSLGSPTLSDSGNTLGKPFLVTGTSSSRLPGQGIISTGRVFTVSNSTVRGGNSEHQERDSKGSLIGQGQAHYFQSYYPSSGSPYNQEDTGNQLPSSTGWPSIQQGSTNNGRGNAGTSVSGRRGSLLYRLPSRSRGRTQGSRTPQSTSTTAIVFPTDETPPPNAGSVTDQVVNSLYQAGYDEDDDDDDYYDDQGSVTLPASQSANVQFQSGILSSRTYHTYHQGSRPQVARNQGGRDRGPPPSRSLTTSSRRLSSRGVQGSVFQNNGASVVHRTNLSSELVQLGRRQRTSRQGGLPDLRLDNRKIINFFHLDSRTLSSLECARGEKCLSSSAYVGRDGRLPRPNSIRKLLRFQTTVHNIGDGPFLPASDPSEWKWHQCHNHSHSMAVFTHYDLLDGEGRKVAEGHKASFCLEDSACRNGVKKFYDCEKGVQGISAQCEDTYKASIDCQWIDVTDVPHGEYVFRVLVNPDRLVPEKSFHNNGVRCNVNIGSLTADIWGCKHFEVPEKN